VHRGFVWALLVGLAVALVLLIMWHDEGTIAGLVEQDVGSLIYKIVLVVIAGSMALSLFRHRFGEASNYLLELFPALGRIG